MFPQSPRRTRLTRRPLLFALTISVVSLSAYFLAGSLTARFGGQFARPEQNAAAAPGGERLFDAYGKLPLSFEANHGQTDARVKFLSRGSGYSLFLTNTEAVLALSKSAATVEGVETAGRVEESAREEARLRRGQVGAARQQAVVRMRLLGANPSPRSEGLEELAGRSHYLIGRDRSKWRRGVPSYARAEFRGVYRGVDVVYYGNQRQLEYDFRVAAGADPRAIRLGFEGADSVKLNGRGELVLSTPAGEVIQRKPFTYQEVAGARREVRSAYTLDEKGRVRFDLGEYDRSLPLVIDPVLVYSTYFGGSGAESAVAIDVDAAGSAYITGRTTSVNFPRSTTLPSTDVSGGDVFVTKLSPAGDAAIYSTFFGGDLDDSAAGVAVDADGNAYVAGTTASFNFPSAGANVFQPNKAGGNSPFYQSAVGGASWTSTGAGLTTSSVSTIRPHPTDPQVVYAGTYNGGAVYKSADAGNTWARISDGIINTFINDVAVAPGAPDKLYAAACGGPDPTLVYRSEDGGQTWLPSTGIPAGTCVESLAVDPNAPTTIYAGNYSNAVYRSTDGGQTWAAFNDGLAHADGGFPAGLALAVDPRNSTVYLAGDDGKVYRRASGDAAWVTGGQDVGSPGDGGSMLVIPNADPNAASTIYVGTSSGVHKSADEGQTWASISTGLPTNDSVLTVAGRELGGAVRLYAGTLGSGVYESADGGQTWAATGIGGLAATSVGVTAGATPKALAGVYTGTDAFVAKLNGAGDALLYSTHLGGGTSPGGIPDDVAYALALDDAGNAYVSGFTRNATFPTANAVQPSFGGNIDGFVTKLNPAGSALVFSTYLGGTGNDQARAIAVDPAGNNAVVAGSTNSQEDPNTPAREGFPVKFPLQATRTGGLDAFLAKYNTAGTDFVYSTYLGGARADQANAVATDSDGNAYVTGQTNSLDMFPVTPAPLNSYTDGACGQRRCYDVFITKINPIGSTRLYAAFLGGSGDDVGKAIAVDNATRNAYLTGHVASANFPTRNPVQPAFGGNPWDAFLTSLAADGMRLNSTYFGGSGDDQGLGIALGPGDSAYVAGSTTSANLTTAGAVQGGNQGGTDAFVAKFGHVSSPDPEPTPTPAPTPTPSPTATPTPSPTPGATFVVNSDADTSDSVCDAANCTLREAVNAANAAPGLSTIHFNIGGGGARTINATNSFFINEAVTIDATTQPGYAGQPLIEINGAGTTGSNGLWITGGGTRVKGLVINRFQYAAINLQGDNNVVEGCYLGTNLAGNGAAPNGSGVNVQNGANNLIGGTSAAARNVISGNNGNGISVNSPSTGTQIKGNYIGLKADGSGALPQPNWAPGVGLYSVSNTTVGGTEPGARNVISGNKGPGVFLSNTWPGGTPGASNNVVQGNYIGTMPDGNGALINEGGGVGISAASNNNLIGGTGEAARNVIANGVNLDGAGTTANRIQGNYIGVKLDGSGAIYSAGWAGVQMRGVSGNFIGGDTPGARNVISGNNGPGIWIVNTCTECNPAQPHVPSTNNYVQGNLIGTNPGGTGPVPNKGSGVSIDRGSTGNVVGGASALARNVISGNSGEGVNVSNWGYPADNNVIQGNYIGTNESGTGQVRNMQNGVGVYGVSGTQIVGNLITGNNNHGISVGAGNPGPVGNSPTVGSTNTIIRGNLIGTNLLGVGPVAGFKDFDDYSVNPMVRRVNHPTRGNGFGGITINSSSGTQIGGATEAERNVIAGNDGPGVGVSRAWNNTGGSNNTVIRANYVGMDANGGALANNNGIYIDSGSSGTQIGGAAQAERNFISGNNGAGISVGNYNSAPSGTLIQNNYIGTKRDGSGALANGRSGVELYGPTGTQILGNVISGNTGSGLHISGGSPGQGQPNVGTSGTQVFGNYIGTAPGGMSAVPNGSGISLLSQANNSTIGGTGPGQRNFISGNNGDGINFGSHNGAASNNVVRGNLIGLKSDGLTALPNTGNGIAGFGVNNTHITGNVISGNNRQGVNFSSSGSAPSTNIHIKGNLIGTNETGNAPVGNLGGGVNISGSNAVFIGGAGEGNTISGNPNNGVAVWHTRFRDNLGNIVDSPSSNVTIQGNYIGTNADGASNLGNAFNGISLNGTTASLVGGTAAGARNVISNNGHSGIYLGHFRDFDSTNVRGSDNNTVQGNLIGTKPGGDSPLTPAAGNSGIRILGSSNNLIGGNTPEAANVISGNRNHGLAIEYVRYTEGGAPQNPTAGTITERDATGNRIQGNYIGTNAAGASNLGNTNLGVGVFGASGNLVGGIGPGEGNVIAHNATAGVNVACGNYAGTARCATGTALLSNSIHSNLGVGINLGSNGALFGNNNQAAPSLGFLSAADAAVTGALTSAPNSTFTVQVFANSVCDPTSGAGEGQTLVGTASVTTDAAGNASFSAPAPLAAGQVITATATSAANNTSRFSPCAPVYAATANIAGRVTDAGAPLAGVTITLGGGQSATATTDAGGNYSFNSLPANLSYTVSASHPEHDFSPSSWSYDRLRGNQLANFTRRRVEYTVKDLGTLGSQTSFGIALNESGHVVGQSPNAGNVTHGFFHNGSAMLDMGTLGGTTSTGWAVNDAGKAAGNSQVAGNAVQRAFTYLNGVLTDLGTLGAGSSFARGINNSGQVVGWSNTLVNGQSGPQRAYRTAPGAPINPTTDDLGTLPGGAFSQAFAVNESGQVVGISGTATPGANHAFLYSGGSMQDLGTLGGATSIANGINDAGAVVGQAEYAPGSTAFRAFLYSGGAMQDLGTLGGLTSTARGINSAGVVVGNSEYNPGSPNFVRAFVHKDGVMIDLNSRIAADAGWSSLTVAYAVNDAGQIAGYGVINGQTHAFLLTPTSGKTDQTVTFDAITDKTFGDASFALTATASSGLPVTFTVVSGPATVSGNTLTITGAGQVTVRASQAGDASYNAAPDVERTFTVAKAAATLSLGNLAHTYDGAAKSASVTTTPANLAGVAVSYAQGGVAVAAPTNAGSYDVTASLDNANYQATPAAGTLVISKADQTINFPVPANKTFGDAPFALAATASSGLPVSYQVVSGPATVGGDTLTITGAGVVNVRASQAGDANHKAAASVDRSFTVLKATPAVSLNSSPNPSDAGEAVTFTATLNPALAGTVTFRDGNTVLSIASLSGGAASFTTSALAVGSHSVTATYNGQDANYGVAASPAHFHSVSATVTATVTEQTATDSDGAPLTDPATGEPLPPIDQATAQVSVDSSTITATLPNPDGDSVQMTVSAIPPAEAPSLPSGYEIAGAGLAYEITTPPGSYDTSVTAPSGSEVTVPIKLCFAVPTVSDEATFNSLSIIHFTAGPPPSSEVLATTRDFPNRMLCGEVTSLSPFLIARPAAPAPAPAFTGGVAGPSAPVLVGAVVSTGASVKNLTPGATPVWSWGDGTTSGATVGATPNADGSTPVSGTHTYATPGVYLARLRIKDAAGGSVESSTQVFVYDPRAGFTTGGGWIDSTAGSYLAEALLAGKAEFSFDVKYLKGATAPSGAAEFKLPGLHFRAAALRWLGVAGTRAQFAGEGTLNNRGGYSFLLTATDEQKKGGGKGGDRLRLKVWDAATKAVVYDNQLGSPDGANPANALGGGNVVLYRK